MTDFREYDPEYPVPDDAPEDLKILAANISDILGTIKLHRSPEYHRNLILMMSLFSQVAELENIACESTQIIKSIGEEVIQDSDLINGATLHHQMTHLYGDSISKHLHMLVDIIMHDSAFAGFDKDLETLMNRIKRDWKDKGH